MVQNPCTDTALSLYRLMSGIHATILEVLPEETLTSFQTECKRALRNLDDHMGNLLCLATFAKIAAPFTERAAIASSSRREEVASPLDATPEGKHASNQEQNSTIAASEKGEKREENKGEEHSPWLCSILQFFGPKHGMKTLDLVVVRVILACSSSSTLSIPESMHGIQLAKQICDAVEPAQRDTWVRNNGAKLVKLCEKVLRTGIDSKVQTMVWFPLCSRKM